MRFGIALYLRGPAAEVASRIPKGLEVLRAMLRDLPDRGESFTGAKVDLQTRNDILEWARAPLGDRSIGRLATLSEELEAGDLHGSGLLELDWEGTDFPPPDVLNAGDAFLADWRCTHCRRLNVSQVADLKLFDLAPVDFQETIDGDLIVSKRVWEILQDRGVLSRALVGVPDYRQIVPDRTCELVLDAPPFAADSVCPGCGECRYTIDNDVEGRPYDPNYPGLSIRLAHPSLPVRCVASESLLVSHVRLGGSGDFSPTPLHPVGEPVVIDQGMRGTYGLPRFFVGDELAIRLAGLPASGVKFHHVVRRGQVTP